MRRVAHPYMRWEDYLAGMYDKSATPSEHTDDAYELLTDRREFADAVAQMLAAWPTAAENWLTRPRGKSRSWLGAAACMHRAGVPEHCTRVAWWLLSADQRDEADAIADAAREKWIAEREEREHA